MERVRVFVRTGCVGVAVGSVLPAVGVRGATADGDRDTDRVGAFSAAVADDDGVTDRERQKVADVVNVDVGGGTYGMLCVRVRVGTSDIVCDRPGETVADRDVMVAVNVGTRASVPVAFNDALWLPVAVGGAVDDELRVRVALRVSERVGGGMTDPVALRVADSVRDRVWIDVRVAGTVALLDGDGVGGRVCVAVIPPDGVAGGVWDGSVDDQLRVCPVPDHVAVAGREGELLPVADSDGADVRDGSVAVEVAVAGAGVAVSRLWVPVREPAPSRGVALLVLVPVAT